MRKNIDLYNITEDPNDLKDALVELRSDFDEHNHDGTSSKFFETIRAETLLTRTISIKKSNYSDNTEGLWMGLDGVLTKLFLGSSTNYLKWNGSTIEIKGEITASSGTIGGFTIGIDYLKDAADSFGLSSEVTGGDDVRFWAGDTEANKATAPFRVTEAGAVTVSDIDIKGGAVNINDKAIIDSGGKATFVGISSLNMKAFTNFEGSGRFYTTVGGTGATTFVNQGMMLATGATATSYVRTLWNATSYILSQEPTFTCVLTMDTIGTIDGQFAVGLGLLTVAGAGFTELDGKNFCGFYLKKAGGAVTLAIFQQKSDNTYSYQNDVTPVPASTVLELFMKVKSTGVTYYYRKSGGALTTIATLTTGNPAGEIQQYIYFANTNLGTASDFKVLLHCAAYEH